MKAIGGHLPLISFLLVLVLVLVIVVAGGDGRAGLSDGAIANPTEVKAYWEATLPNTPMPQAILDMLAPPEGEISTVNPEYILAAPDEEMQSPQANKGDDQKMAKFLLYNKDKANEGVDQKMAKFLLYNKDEANEGDDQKMAKFLLYNKDETNEGVDQKMAKFLLYNKDEANEGVDQKMAKFLLYNKDEANEGVDQKMAKLLLYNKDEANEGVDQKMAKLLLYNKDEANEGVDQKMAKFLWYNKDEANEGVDQKMAKFLLYNKDKANEGVNQKMAKFLLYNKDEANEGDDQKMAKILWYNKDETKEGDDQKMAKILWYNKDEAKEGDDQKMAKLLWYNKDKAKEGDDQKMAKFLLYNKDETNEGVDQKMAKFLLYNKDEANEGDDQKMAKFLLYNKDEANEGDDQKMAKFLLYNKKLGEELKHIHNQRHGHVHLPKGARDIFFFEDNIAPGSVLTTRIMSTRSSSIFLHRDYSKNIPFSMKKFTNIVNTFAPVSRTMAEDITTTLRQCEHPQMVHGEKAGCATSIESFVDLIVSLLGTNNVRALSPRAPMEGVPSLTYTVASTTPVTNSTTVLVCHDMPYPYKVFFCHTSTPTRAYQVSLVSNESGRPSIDALVVCHLNTSHWDADHPFFHLMNVKPGETTACHFLGRGNIIWVPAVKEATQ